VCKAMIETVVSRRHNLTIYKCSGDLSEAEISNAIQFLYNDQPTLHLLWDLSNASMDGISSTFVRKISTSVRERGIAVQDRKIAVIAPKDLEYGIARMFQILSNESRFPFKIKVFKYVGEACQWILEKE
jgi:hypothetical protein